ncbi:O-succinylbenzoate-CoA synthase, partial [Mycobacterium sp. ITM-2017-0098]
PDAVRGRIPVVDGARRVVVDVHDIDTAVETITGLDRAVELVELVCRTPEDAHAVRRRVDLPIAVDATLLAGNPQCADIAVLRCG